MARKKEEKKEKDTEKKKSFVEQIRIAYRSLEDPKKFYTGKLIPLIFLGIIVMIMPFVLGIFILIDLNPTAFLIGGVVPIFLGIFYPFIKWKNKENDINSKMHFFITHLRVLAISDLSLKDIVNMLGGKKAYGALGEELRRISILSTQWRMPLSRAFRFISERTPSKILKDFLDRFSQSLDSGVEHREFIETEQEAVLQEYKTMYESSNENIVILNEVYVSLLIAIVFVMSIGIVLPFIMGTENMLTFVAISSFILIASEGMLMYLLKAMIPADEIWHVTGEKSETEEKMDRIFKTSVILTVLMAVSMFILKYNVNLPFIESLPIEVIVAISFTPLIISGIIVFKEEQIMSRKEKNFLSFLPALGSISTMRGGRINESVYYLSEKDYGVLTKHIRDLYRRLRTRIDDDAAWEWFGVDTGSNYIQRASEMFREATYAAANPRLVSRMISENIRKIRDLRVKKLTIINTSIALFAGITFGIAFAVYISLIIGERLNKMIPETYPTAGTEMNINIGNILFHVAPEQYVINFYIVFFVLIVHCLMLALTIRLLRGSHKYLTLLYFVPFVWIVTITFIAVRYYFGGII